MGSLRQRSDRSSFKAGPDHGESRDQTCLIGVNHDSTPENQAPVPDSAAVGNGFGPAVRPLAGFDRFFILWGVALDEKVLSVARATTPLLCCSKNRF